jgi:hypothetical protein
MRSLVVLVKLHVAITRMCWSRRNDQISLAALASFPAVHPRGVSARTHIPGPTLENPQAQRR